MDADQRCRREVEELHAFFEQWFNGAVRRAPDAIGRFENVLAPTFQLVSPDGEILPRRAVLRTVEGAYSSARGMGGSMQVSVRNIQHHFTIGEVTVVTYEEWQSRGSDSTARLTSAVFGSAPKTPNGVWWLHVHETWLR